MIRFRASKSKSTNKKNNIESTNNDPPIFSTSSTNHDNLYQYSDQSRFNSSFAITLYKLVSIIIS